MNSKSQRTPLVKKKIRKEPTALWPICQSRPETVVNESQLQTPRWHRHMPGWLSHCTIRLVTHSMKATLHSSRHTTTFLFLCCHNEDATITAKLVSRDREAQTRTGKTGKLDNCRHEAQEKTQLQKSKVEECVLMTGADTRLIITETGVSY